MREMFRSSLANGAEKTSLRLRRSTINEMGRDCSTKEQSMPSNILENEE